MCYVVIAEEDNMSYNRYQYRWFFQVADSDQDGFLNYKEFKEALTHFNYTGPESDLKVSAESDTSSPWY